MQSSSHSARYSHDPAIEGSLGGVLTRPGESTHLLRNPQSQDHDYTWRSESLIASRGLAWFLDHGLNGSAYLFLHAMSPMRAMRCVQRLAQIRRPLDSKSAARRLSQRLGSW